MSSSPSRNGRVAEVAEQCSVAGQQQLLGVLPAECPGIHLALEVGDGLVEHRPHHGGEIDRQMAAAVDRGAPNEADVVGIVGEVVEAGVEHQLDLRPALFRRRDGDRQAAEPVRQEPFEDLAVERLLGGEVVEQARPANADAGSDVVERRALVAVGAEAGDGLVEDQLARGAGRRDVRRLIGELTDSSWGWVTAASVASDGPLPTGR